MWLFQRHRHVLSIIFVLLIDVQQNDGQILTKNIIQKESYATASIIRSISVRTAEQKAQLVDMANSLGVWLNIGVHALNSALPSITSSKDSQLLTSTIATLSTLCNDIQQTAIKDATKLQEKLAATVEEFKKLGALVHGELSAPTPFLINQVNRAHVLLIFALFKLQAQSKLLNKSNQELQPDIILNSAETLVAIDSLPFRGKITEPLLRQILNHLTLIKAIGLNRLNNWVDVNLSNKETPKVQDVVVELSEEYENLNRLASIKYRGLHFKRSLKNSIKASTKQAVELTRLKTAGTLGSIQYIRGSLFDDVAVGKTYSVIIRSAVSQH